MHKIRALCQLIRTETLQNATAAWGNVDGYNGTGNSEKEAKMAIRSRFFQDPKQSFFLFGPRGTGKSTWLHNYFNKGILRNRGEKYRQSAWKNAQRFRSIA